MPLHLLGKKSWNVYNADNIARVRRDEALAKAREEEEERRMQEVDAGRRLAILRGEEPPPLPPADDACDEKSHRRDRDRDHERAIPGKERRKRKRSGEDDTDFEIRLAKERSALVSAASDLKKSTSSAPIVDRSGHIDLFGEDRSGGRAEKNEEAEREAAKKKREYEDQYTMRFSNAAGKGGLQGPWYSKLDTGEADFGPPNKDVWGNEDPGRKTRETKRVVDNDPLAAMKSGARKVRELKKERRSAREEMERDLEALRKEQKRREKRLRRDLRKDRERADSKEEGRYRHRREGDGYQEEGYRIRHGHTRDRHSSSRHRSGEA